MPEIYPSLKGLRFTQNDLIPPADSGDPHGGRAKRTPVVGGNGDDSNLRTAISSRPALLTSGLRKSMTKILFGRSARPYGAGQVRIGWMRREKGIKKYK